ncbi:MAG: hypothetical protein BWX79_01166 [Alphaproteobacteria bacterium ADurb.Bin100]|nr:MAG: hypothetical protein BWX79_01166 [Alphaproteobacteria bacterium ADurb.Bin100]
MEARTGAHRLGDTALGKPAGGLHEKGGVPVRRAQAQLAGVAGAVGGVGELLDQRGEILAGAGALRDAFRAGLQRGDLGRLRILRNRHQHHAQVNFGIGLVGAALLFQDELVDVDLGDAGLGFQFALAHLGQQDLVAQVFPKLADRHSVLGQATAQLRHGDLVLAGNRKLGLIHRGVVHLDAGLAGELHLGLLVDHAFQHLAREHVTRRQRATLLGELLLGADQLGQDLVVGDGFAVDHDHDEVRLAGSGAGGPRVQAAAQAGGTQPAGPQAARRAQALCRRGRRQQRGHQQRARQDALSDFAGRYGHGKKARLFLSHSC